MIQVSCGAMMMCSFGLAPSTLAVTPVNKCVTTTPAATIMDMKPGMNIPPFGMCTSLANPAVASATAAALGVLTPQPCTPLPAGPWAPGATKTTIAGQPALHNACQLTCSFAGVITISSPGETKVNVT